MPTRLLLLSEWAKCEISSAQVYTEIVRSGKSGDGMFHDIENFPIVHLEFTVSEKLT